ncbi:MAG TPA: AMP-binding protein [Bacteroidia bacterium]|nr:AMP-binding protein [Bacteroidia bacterium]
MNRPLEEILRNILVNREKPAFCVAGTHYTYAEFGACVATIQQQIQSKGMEANSTIGILTYDDLQTYASVFAILFSGHTFVPINPLHPVSRNESILEQAEISVLLSSMLETDAMAFSSTSTMVLKTNMYADISAVPAFKEQEPERLAYILFTSGSTGVPKGVPLTINNLESFLRAFFELGFTIDSSDRFIQMFDMTFDLSIMSYMAPLCIGACVYTVPFDGIKYMQVYRLLEEHEITFALLVPSIITHLRPYFEEITLEKMKYSLFCGEALYEDVTMEWAKCIPNANLLNVYGPTEATIFCTTYPIKREGRNKCLNGILCIGKAMNNMGAVIFNDAGNPAAAMEKGELCLQGKQVTPGYWKNEQKNKEAFFRYDNIRYYRTGDLCYADAEGDISYSGRIDFQVKIQGFRVELGEIEMHAREFLKTHAVVAIAKQNEATVWQIYLFVENYSKGTTELLQHLKETLPGYMLPAKIIGTGLFPLNSNGKTDRKALMQQVGL